MTECREGAAGIDSDLVARPWVLSQARTLPRICEDSSSSPPRIPVYTASPPRTRGISLASRPPAHRYASPPRLRGTVAIVLRLGKHLRFTPPIWRESRADAVLAHRCARFTPRSRDTDVPPTCSVRAQRCDLRRVPPLKVGMVPYVQALRISMSPHPKARALPNPCRSRSVNSSTPVNRTIPVRFRMPMVASCPPGRRRCRRP